MPVNAMALPERRLIASAPAVLSRHSESTSDPGARLATICLALQVTLQARLGSLYHYSSAVIDADQKQRLARPHQEFVDGLPLSP
jgi:hypothetical protein